MNDSLSGLSYFFATIAKCFQIVFFESRILFNSDINSPMGLEMADIKVGRFVRRLCEGIGLLWLLCSCWWGNMEVVHYVWVDYGSILLHH